LSHVDERGRARMVDVSDKVATVRTARARAEVWIPAEAAQRIGLDRAGDQDVCGPKGPVFHTASIAGVMAAKRTHELIPLCHPLPIEHVHVDVRAVGAGLVEIVSECRTTHKTGVEMEALTAASVAALTVYDMCKALSHDIEIRNVRLLAKTGGKEDHERA
jgi:cyclic pyranopterin monophosphate synthase